MKSVYFFLPFVSASFSLNAANTSIPMLDKSYQESSQQQEDPIFTCRTNQGKIIQLNKYDEVYIYRFGANLNNPELTLTSHIENITKGVITKGAIEIKRFYELTSGNYTYHIFYTNPKAYDENGVEVFKNNQSVAKVLCSGGIEIYE
ncbi:MULTISPECIES: hypothetical protein [Pasteurella]|uniref:hypothetical protein n=1 Tax=Pasteurella TaxID=745 RepID=UPI0002144E67|nr:MULTISPECIES: hypothetical protein [Pasteurella]EGP04002.1 hypothetical protein AAUPMG_08846 [Pasteurella multocida subsp. multocida str. Anand1_goat]AMM82500.1 hypothetical protein AW43_08920 [Pasteurella multocida subsp. multocida PMTB2.1]APW57194.1 hypothetical protein BV212_02855 [Pasteurella multocida]AXQ73315.1 hypothetical protein AWY89_10120 [Pasteurella multocida subsp. multocida]KWW10008.1 hypothetical protein VM82_04525 [Pasteurella multocida]